jgi:hypothetical protein
MQEEMKSGVIGKRPLYGRGREEKGNNLKCNKVILLMNS